MIRCKNAKRSQSKAGKRDVAKEIKEVEGKAERRREGEARRDEDDGDGEGQVEDACCEKLALQTIIANTRLDTAHTPRPPHSQRRPANL